MRTWVLATRCMGHAACQQLAPEVFMFDEELERAYVEEEVVPPSLQGAVRRAALACPEQAIVVVDGEEVSKDT